VATACWALKSLFFLLGLSAFLIFVGLSPEFFLLTLIWLYWPLEAPINFYSSYSEIKILVSCPPITIEVCMSVSCCLFLAADESAEVLSVVGLLLTLFISSL
jgi:hypothetical protein